MVQLRRLRTADESPREIIGGVNRIIDALLGNSGGRIALLDDDGELRDTIGGALLGSSEPSLKVRSAVGEHALFEHSNGIDMILEIQDSGVTFGAGFPLTIGQWTVQDVTNDLVWKDDGAVERIRFYDTGSASGHALLVTGNIRTTASLVVDDWAVAVTGNDLKFSDDAGLERFRIGDTSSTYAALATGNFGTTGLAHVEDGLVVGGTSFAGSEITRLIGATRIEGATTVTTGDVTVSSGNLVLGATVAATGTIRGTNTTSYVARNNANSADVNLISKDAGDSITVGNGTNANVVGFDGANGTQMRHAGVTRLSTTTTSVDITGIANVSSYATVGSLSGTPVANALYNQLIVKAWAVIDVTGTPAINGGANVASIVDVAVGDWVFQFDRDFSSTAYAAMAICQTNNAYYTHLIDTSLLAGQVRVNCRDAAGALVDPTRVHCLAIGVQ